MSMELVNILNGIKNIINEKQFFTYYIENGFLLEFKEAVLKVKKDNLFGWIVYIDEYMDDFVNKEIEDSINTIYSKILNYLNNINDSLNVEYIIA